METPHPLWLPSAPTEERVAEALEVLAGHLRTNLLQHAELSPFQERLVLRMTGENIDLCLQENQAERDPAVVIETDVITRVTPTGRINKKMGETYAIPVAEQLVAESLNAMSGDGERELRQELATELALTFAAGMEDLLDELQQPYFYQGSGTLDSYDIETFARERATDIMRDLRMLYIAMCSGELET